jgi:hypothetical protein
MIVIDNKYELGEIVYLITDEDQRKRVVISIFVTPENCIMYEVQNGINFSRHYDFELSREMDQVLKTNS